jgi:hypothetical protein
VDSSSITVSWDAVAGVAGSKVYRSTSEDGTYTYLDGYYSSSYTTPYTTYDNTGLSSNTTYYYKVSAFSSSREGSQSLPVSATTKLSAPTGNSAVAVDSSSITVSWTEVTGATGYKVYRSDTSSGTYEKVGDNLLSTDTSYTDTGLSSNTTYYYKVSALGSGGEGLQSSYVSARTPNSSFGISAITYETVSGGAWVLQTDGRYKSPATNHSDTAKFRVSFTSTSNASIVIQLDVSSEQGCDFAFISQLDGDSTTYQSISGPNNSVTVTIPVSTSGTHSIDIGYRKDGSATGGSDCAWFKVIE